MFSIFVNIIHILLILYVLFGLFISNKIPFILIYLMTLISLNVHWYVNNDSCILTLIEKKLTNVSDKKSFINRIVNPIYIIKDKNISIISKIITLFLFIIGIIILYNKRDEFIMFLKDPLNEFYY